MHINGPTNVGIGIEISMASGLVKLSPAMIFRHVKRREAEMELYSYSTTYISDIFETFISRRVKHRVGQIIP